MAEKAKQVNQTYIKIKPRTGIRAGYYHHSIKEKNGYYSVAIPAFDIYFSAPSLEEADKRSLQMVDAFFEFWIKQQGWKNFILQIIKLGFKPESDFITKELLNDHRNKAKFMGMSDFPVPPEFKGNQVATKEVVREMAY